MEENKGIALLRSELPQLKALIGLNAKPGVDTNILALQELEYLQMQALTKADILNCEPITIVQAVKSVLKNNLSLDPSVGLVYVTTRSMQIGGAWKKVLETTPTANGMLSINYQCGKILDHKNPEVRKDPNTGKVIEVSFEFQNARGRWEIKRWDESDFERWRASSHKQNSRGWKPENANGRPQPDAAKLNYANPLYTSFKGGIDPEFARAKAVKHGLKKLGTNPNEIQAAQIIVQPKRVNIDTEKEQASLREEIQEAKPGEEQFTAHEEISSTPVATQAPAAPVESPQDKIKRLDELKKKIPSASDL